MVAKDGIEEKIETRPVTDGDREFLLRVYAAGREIELAAVPWDESTKRSFVEHQFTAQDAFYKQEYPDSTHELVLANSIPVGRIYISRESQQIAILDLAILPEHRRHGIATALIEALQIEARGSGVSIRIFIETFNPADRLFRALGFEEVSSDGISRRFEWRPE